MTTGTATVANAVPSACAVAFPVYVLGSAGAEYSPAAVIVPPALSGIDHVTVVSGVPLTVAVNCRMPPVSSTPDGPLIVPLIDGGGALPELPEPLHPIRRTALAHPIHSRMALKCSMTSSPRFLALTLRVIRFCRPRTLTPPVRTRCHDHFPNAKGWP